MPRSAVLVSRDPDEFMSSVRGADVKTYLTRPGEFHAELAHIDLHRVWLQRGRSSLPMVAHSTNTLPRSPVFFSADPELGPAVVAAMDMTPADILWESPGFQCHLRTSGAFEWGAVSAPPDDLAAAARALTGRDLRSPDVARLIRPPAELTDRLRRLHKSACDLASTAPDMIAHPEVAKAMEQALLQVMAACLFAGAAIDAARGGRVHEGLMRRFERVLEAHAGQPLYLMEVCSELGVSDRVLRLYCQEHLGMSPHRYLLLRRMHLARRALARADGKRTTVTSIATEYGFGELGRFSVQYRELFGEGPSVTLRRPPDEPRSVAMRQFEGPVAGFS
jgi:AraC-like DNA-binding protein